MITKYFYPFHLQIVFVKNISEEKDRYIIFLRNVMSFFNGRWGVGRWEMGDERWEI